MITSLLKGVLFVLLMFFYSASVWRLVNDYFRKEFKSYIELDPDVSHDKELKTLLTHPATTTPSPSVDSEPTTFRMPPGLLASGDYNEVTFGQTTIGPRLTTTDERIASDGSARTSSSSHPGGDAGTISITSESIEQPSSSAAPESTRRTPNNNQPDATTVLIELSAQTPRSHHVKQSLGGDDDRVGKQQRKADVGVIGDGDDDDEAFEAAANAISSGNQNEMNESAASSTSVAAVTTTGKVITSSHHDVEEVRTEMEFCRTNPVPPPMGQ